MKHLTLIAALALASTAAFAQAPAGTTMRSPQEANAARSGGMAANTAEARKDAKTMGSGMAMDWKTLDANGDGMISQEEYMTYHTTQWKKMRMTRDGMISQKDMQAQMMKNGDGPN